MPAPPGFSRVIERDWRNPDQAYSRPEDGVDEGLTSAELVVEVCSAGDESYEKLGFYAARGIQEVLIVHEDRRFELRQLGMSVAATARQVWVGQS